jgi:hypothetical protein
MADTKQLNEPESAILSNLASVDDTMKMINGSHPTDFTVAAMAVAQVHATTALVHAVRELTQAVREGRTS